MAILKYSNVGIIAMAACVPKGIERNIDLKPLLGEEQTEKVISNIGIVEKRHVDANTTAADLCFAAAEKLLTDNNIDRSTIDVLIFISQLPDYTIPATSPSLQHRLGLSQSTACFDINLACSGYVYGLSAAFAYASQPSVNRVLLLDGETFSKIVSPKDRVNAPLYGDAGTATLIEKQENAASVFTLYSDGSGVDALKIPAGSARCIATDESIKMTEREDGNFRTDHQIYMDGVEVFNFTLRVVPTSIKEILRITEETVSTIDYFVFHQANKFMIDFFVKKLKIEPGKVPISLDTFGNVSSATIPLTIVSRMKESLAGSRKKLLLCGFGAGLSWADCILDLENCVISDLIEL